MRVTLLLALLAAASPAMRAQQPIGTVGVGDATVSGALEVSNGRAVLVGNTTVMAKDHVAEVALNRGGEVRVCSTSGLHLTAGKGTGDSSPLMLALDRGAIEVRMPAMQNDIVMTPDLRFSMRSPGPLDLSIRVTPNGDTCVENRGDHAPTLGIADQFGQSSYELKPGQHVLFEHGNLKEVVDHESSPCGCPTEPVVSVADSGVTSSNPAAPGSAVSNSAEEQHPFPAAVSAGLAPSNPVPQAQPGVVHAQVTTTMSYGGNDGASSEGTPGSSTASSAPPAATTASSASTAPPASATQTSVPAPAPETAQAPPPPPAPAPNDLFHYIGRFFKRIFTGK